MSRLPLTDPIRAERLQNRNRRRARKAYSELYLDCPGQWHPDGTNATSVVVSNADAVIDFATGASGSMYTTIEKKPMWARGGELQVTLVYTGTASSSNVFDVHLRCSERALGDAMTGTHSQDIQNDVPGSVTANTTKEHTFDTNLTVGGGGSFLTFRVQRDGASDSNSGSLRITGVKLRYLSRR